MTAEDRLREAMRDRAAEVDPSPDALSRIQEELMEAQRSNDHRRALLGLGAAAAVIALVVAAVVLTNRDDEPVSSDGSTTTTESTTTSSTTTSTTSTTVPFQGVDPDVPLFPDPTSSQRFDSPDSAANGFAVWARYQEPVLGAFQPGDDDRAGDIEVRAFPEAAPTVIALRQLEDDAWYVVGVSTDSIRLTTPEPGDTLTSPQALEGMAYAFEGHVTVRLYADGVADPIGQTFVTGRGDGVLGAFSGEITFTNDTGATHGVLALYSESALEGAPTIEITAIRVRL